MDVENDGDGEGEGLNSFKGESFKLASFKLVSTTGVFAGVGGPKPQGGRMNIWGNKPQDPEGIGICRKMARNKLKLQRTGTLDDCFGALHLR